MRIVEVVNATIIGGEWKTYAFFDRLGNRLSDEKALYFANDDEAIDYARDTWPAQYRRGIEMRCWD